MISLEGKVAIVTGAGSGLGRSYAKALASRGARVLVNDLGAAVDGSGSASRPADDVADEIRADGGTAVADYHTVATPVGGKAIVEHAISEFDGVDILVNNAGNIKLASMAKLDVEHIDEILDVHLGGAFYVTQPAYRAMLGKQAGSIVFTTSGVATFGNLGASTYGAAKGGIIGLLHVLKLEAARHGIRVNGIAPMAQTRMSADVELSEYEAVTDRSISPDLVAAAVVYLVSDECDLTGEIWSAGSGSVARLFTGRTQGYFQHPEVKELTPEDVAANVASIRDTHDFTEPETWPAEWGLVLDSLRDSSS